MDSDAPPSVGFYNFLGWFEANKKRVVIGAGIVLVAGTIAGIWVWHNSEREIEAEEALAAVHTPFNPSEPTPPGTAEAFLKIVRDYPNTSAAAKALLRAGTAYFADGNYPKAREQFDTFIRNFPDSPWVSEAVFGNAACLDAEGKTTEAIAKYNDFLKYNDASADQARLNLARLYEQTKQPALALDLLNKLVNPQQGYNPAAAEAQQMIKELYAQHPELMAPAPTPPTTPPIRPPTPSASNAAPRPTIVPSPNSSAASNRPQIFLPGYQPGSTPGK